MTNRLSKAQQEAINRFQDQSQNQLSNAIDRVAQKLKQLAERRKNKQ